MCFESCRVESSWYPMFVLTVKRLHKTPTSSVILDMPCWEHSFRHCGEAKIHFKVEGKLLCLLGLIWHCLICRQK